MAVLACIAYGNRDQSFLRYGMATVILLAMSIFSGVFAHMRDDQQTQEILDTELSVVVIQEDGTANFSGAPEICHRRMDRRIFADNVDYPAEWFVEAMRKRGWVLVPDRVWTFRCVRPDEQTLAAMKRAKLERATLDPKNADAKDGE